MHKNINHLLYFFTYLLSALCLLACHATKKQTALQDKVRMHAHNDYLHKVPLIDALSLGFSSIEVDIFRVDSNLIVSHDDLNLDQKPKLLDLYIKPLTAYAINNKFKIWLMVDLKRYDELTLELLHDIAQARDALFSSRSEKTQIKPVKIVLSGAMPRRDIAHNPDYKYFFIDGRPEHIGKQYDSHIMPLISTNLGYYSSINAIGSIDPQRHAEVLELVNGVHKEGKQFRFWNTKDDKATWMQLYNMEIDLIGTDDLEGLHDFINNKSPIE